MGERANLLVRAKAPKWGRDLARRRGEEEAELIAPQDVVRGCKDGRRSISAAVLEERGKENARRRVEAGVLESVHKPAESKHVSANHSKWINTTHHPSSASETSSSVLIGPPISPTR